MPQAMKKIAYFVFFATILMACTSTKEHDSQEDGDPLPSWNNGESREAILGFVRETTNKDGEFYIPRNERIAVFDNDGTLWSEQPMYFQLAFTIDRIKAMAPEHPEWKSEEPFKSVLEGDLKAALAGGEEALIRIVMATHAGMTTEAFTRLVNGWIDTATHPGTGKLYKEMVFQPMLELLEFLRENDFKTYIISGGGIDFMRPWSEEVYGIPPEQVLGSSGKVKFEIVDGVPVLKKLPELDFIDDKEGKPVGIHKFIGKRPVAAFGNSDGDLAMLQWTDAGGGKRIAVYIHHTDDTREWAYDRDSHIGRLDKGLDEAIEKNWVIVDMKNDWKKIYPSD